MCEGLDRCPNLWREPTDVVRNIPIGSDDPRERGRPLDDRHIALRCRRSPRCDMNAIGVEQETVARLAGQRHLLDPTETAPAVPERDPIGSESRERMFDRMRSDDEPHRLILGPDVAQQDIQLQTSVPHVVVPAELMIVGRGAREISHGHDALEVCLAAEIGTRELDQRRFTQDFQHLGCVGEKVVTGVTVLWHSIVAIEIGRSARHHVAVGLLDKGVNSEAKAGNLFFGDSPPRRPPVALDLRARRLDVPIESDVQIPAPMPFLTDLVSQPRWERSPIDRRTDVRGGEECCCGFDVASS